MQVTDRSSFIIAIFFIGIGVLFLFLTMFQGVFFAELWPLIFFVLAAGFYAPSIFFPDSRQELAALYIPGTIMLGLGMIFFYDTVTNDWGSWAYAWLLIPASVGLGLMLASNIGGWGGPTRAVGLWMLVISVALFGFFGTLFGTVIIRTAGPLMMILGGALLLFRNVKRVR